MEFIYKHYSVDIITQKIPGSDIVILHELRLNYDAFDSL